ncbi:hypothetical protein FJ987_29175 [Mesorhizobium sp. CU2]|uniref:hypothetical protein n=1 Tax=unclassified Mesorhizobium TaxID=325217 RepID=UPI00112D7627|nr:MULTISPECIES: hypothetical protein [unclassified Mesorhizobium]TPN74898.1 hypothetical protein FJ988_30080 [Mesorhizobium sp. CU3]TPO02156.1 hypothetical protein FJ987_29175 [Mesorhizobium sp. CU2]
MNLVANSPVSVDHGNLVIVRAGDSSLHRGWGADEPGCRFDLIVSYYGSDPSAFRLPYERRVDRKGGKWDGLFALFSQQPDLLQRYRYFWLPDDDLETDRKTIEGVFANMRRFDLDVAQPSLTLDSYFSHLPLMRCDSFELRFVDKVEIMAPCIKADLLAKVLPLFEDSMSGFGLDKLWTRLATDNRRKSAVFDSLSVRHTRPVGTALAKAMQQSGLTREAEYMQLRAKYDLDGVFYPISYEAVDRKGCLWRSKTAIGVRMALDYAFGLKAFRVSLRRPIKTLWRHVRWQRSKAAELSTIVLDLPAARTNNQATAC